MSTLRVNTIQNAAGTADPSISGAAKAWVNFNGTGTVAIRRAYNVSSITDNGAGDYTINFTTAMTDDNFSIAALGQSWWITESVSAGRTASSVRVNTFNGGSFTNTDQAVVSVQVFR